MRRDSNAFAEPRTLEEMTSLRQLGWSYGKLGLKYDRDRTTIIYWCKKMNIVPKVKEKVIAYGITKKDITVVNQVISPKLEVEKVNEGKSYAEYLMEEKKRKLGKLSFLSPKRRLLVNPEINKSTIRKIMAVPC